jgi:hypothetical protein
MASLRIMVAASTDSTTVRAARQAVLNPSMLAAGAAGTACVLIAGGCAALAVQAGVGQHASALWMSALAVATMMGAPLLMARSSRRYITLKSAATLIATISAMNAVPGYLKDFQHASVVAASMILTGGVLLCCWRRLVRRDVSLLHHVEPTLERFRSSARVTRVACGTFKRQSRPLPAIHVVRCERCATVLADRAAVHHGLCIGLGGRPLAWQR